MLAVTPTIDLTEGELAALLAAARMRWLMILSLARLVSRRSGQR
jgi:hypothetical protein